MHISEVYTTPTTVRVQRDALATSFHLEVLAPGSGVRGPFPHHQAILQNHLGVLQCNSILMPCPKVKGPVPQGQVVTCPLTIGWRT